MGRCELLRFFPFDADFEVNDSQVMAEKKYFTVKVCGPVGKDTPESCITTFCAYQK